jgi:hypothetical protein
LYSKAGQLPSYEYSRLDLLAIRSDRQGAPVLISLSSSASETRRSGAADLPGLETNGEIGNVDRLGLTRSVRGHDTPTVGLGELNTTLSACPQPGEEGSLRLDRLGDGTDLVDLEQQGVTRLLLDGGLDSAGVGDGQVITDNLDLGRLVEVGPSLPVVLGEGVLDGADVVLLAVRVVETSELLASEPLGGVGVGVLKSQLCALNKQQLTLKSRSYLPSL